MEKLGMKLMDMLAKKAMAYEIHDTKVEMDFDIPANELGVPEMKLKMTCEIGTLKLEIENSDNY